MYRYYLDSKYITEDLEDGTRERYEQDRNAPRNAIFENVIDVAGDLVREKWCSPFLGVEEIFSENRNNDFWNGHIIIGSRVFLKIRKVIYTKEKGLFTTIPGNVEVELPDGRVTNLFDWHKMRYSLLDVKEDVAFLSLDVKEKLRQNRNADIPIYYDQLTTNVVCVYYDDLELQQEMQNAQRALGAYRSMKRQEEENRKKAEVEKVRKQLEYETMKRNANATARRNINDLFRRS